MSTTSSTVESYSTGDEVSRRFTALSGIPSFAIPKGARRFLREFGQWYREYEPQEGVTAIVPPNPTHATTFWTPFDDLHAAAMSATDNGAALARSTANHFLGD